MRVYFVNAVIGLAADETYLFKVLLANNARLSRALSSGPLSPLGCELSTYM